MHILFLVQCTYLHSILNSKQFQLVPMNPAKNSPQKGMSAYCKKKSPELTRFGSFRREKNWNAYGLWYTRIRILMCLVCRLRFRSIEMIFNAWKVPMYKETAHSNSVSSVWRIVFVLFHSILFTFMSHLLFHT